ncbi:MAG: DNA polymerase/3'-5' exonuclease PolX [Planctomycetaceae bacterium]
MQNSEIAHLFDEYADLLEIEVANPFRVRAYRSASRTLGSHPTPLETVAAGGKAALTAIEGIGADLAERIVTCLGSGTFPELEELRQRIPIGVRRMLDIQGLGPKKVAALWKELNVITLEDLRAAAEQGRVADLKGFGKKTATNILEGLDLVQTTGSRFLFADAQSDGEAIRDALLRSGAVTQAEVAGSCRRLQETCGDLDVLAIADDSTAAMDTLASHPLVEKVLARGETKQRVRLKSGIELDLRVVPAESFGAALQYFTGSKEHNIVMRRKAQERELKLNEYGLYRGDVAVAGADEASIYQTLGLPWIPPELRENRGEFPLAEAGELPKLLELADIRGDLHMHTTATDGAASIGEMINAAKARGLEYIAITDHSKRVSMAHGLDADRLRAHWDEIRKLRESVTGIEVLCGIECDILEDATLDLDDDVLSEADWVIAVLHYGLKQPREQIMERLLTAVRSPHVDIIGHPSGRMVGRRPGADIDYPTLFKAAADHGTMMEINANPNRLDLDDIQAAAARDYGIPIVISTDAHSTNGFDKMRYGVYQARRAGLEAKDVANTRPVEEFKSLIR